MKRGMALVLVCLLMCLSCTALAADNPFSGMRTYGAGMYRVGSDMQPGEYVLMATSDYLGYFCVSEDVAQKDIVCNDMFDVNSIVAVRSGEYVELSRCIAIYSSDFYSRYTIRYEGNTGVMLKVGYDIRPGTYRLKQTDSDYDGYYCVYNDNRQDDIEENDLFENTTYVTVRSGQYLELSRCTIVD